jgi:formylglycine-generating enzyme required for sulfatase activity
MGSAADDKPARDDEHPQHIVMISYDYWIARYPITNEQFAKFIASAALNFDQGDWRQTAKHPVVNVSWRAAMAYCRWLNAKLRGEIKYQIVRLPTENEWEKAARGEYGNEWPWGNEFDQTKCNSSEGGKNGTTSVGAYSPQGDRPYGAADMAGSVWEWCHTLYKLYPYQATDGRENEQDYGERVLRGGSWDNDLRFARCASRYGVLPDLLDNMRGFRVAVSQQVLNPDFFTSNF